MIPVHAAAACIKAHIAPAEMLDEPKYDETSDEWIALVAMSPWGPLVTMAFKLSVHCVTVQELTEKETT